MSNEEQIKNFEKEILDKDSLNDMRKFLRDDWEDIKRNEDTLALSISVNKRNEDGVALSLMSPIISSLILMDYDNVDKLIYEILINLIYRYPMVASTINPINGYTLLETSLFNNDLKLNDKQVSFLFNEATKDTKEISELIGILSDRHIYNLNTEINRLKSLIEIRDKNPLFINKPADIKYFILTHPYVRNLSNEVLNKLFLTRLSTCYFGYDNNLYHIVREIYTKEEEDRNKLELLLEDAKERVNIRKLGRIPF